VSIYRQTGLSINISSPLWLNTGYDDWLTDQITGYSHEIAADGGFMKATISLLGNQQVAEDWLADGLGRHVSIEGPAGEIVWQGAINRISIRLGSLSLAIGPLLDLRNRIYVAYNPTDYSITPPASGSRVVTAAANDIDSQALYSILPAVYSLSNLSDAAALAARNRILDELRWPHSTDDMSLGGGGEVSIDLECVGYGDWLLYPYTAAGTGTINASAKVLAVLAANPNIAWLALDTTFVDTNALQVGKEETDYSTAARIIQEVVSQGGTSQERWVFGVYDSLKVYYNAAPTDVEYHQRIASSNTEFETPDGEHIPPWNVRPGRWVLRPDLLVGRIEPAIASRREPRERFIESVSYTAPWGLQARGGRSDTLPQLLEQIRR
jgi:hypothetical protein